MESAAKAAGHSIHQQLIPFPMGLLVTAVVFDVIHLATDNDGFATASYYMIAAGLIGGIAAAIFGVIDYLAIPKNTRASRVALVHGGGNDLLLVLFAISWFLRRGEDAHSPTTVAFILALLGAVMLGATGWLGGELVDRLGVAIDDEAHLDAKTSLKSGIFLKQVREREAAKQASGERL